MPHLIRWRWDWPCGKTKVFMKISINLLPPEVRAQEKKKAKFYMIQVIGVVVTLVMIFLSSLTVALRILQNRNIASYKVRLASAEQKVSNLKSAEESLFLLKNRLAVIGANLGVSSKQSAIFILIDKLIPVSVAVSAINVETSGEVTLTVLVPDSEILDALVNNLTTKENNEGNISKVSVESLNRGKDNFYRVALKISP